MIRFQEEKDGEIRCGLGVLFPKVFSKVKGYLAKEATSRRACYIPIYGSACY